MAITLKVQGYCDVCLDFEAAVTRPQRAYDVNGEVVRQTDTIVECKYSKRCEAIKRYLDSKLTKTERSSDSSGE